MDSLLNRLPSKMNGIGGLGPFLIFAMLLLIMVPVPTFLLDILLLFNIGLSAVIFLLSLQARNVLEFTVLPTMLIFTTLARIVLNVSSSRLILGKADGGKVIDAIGSVTIGGDYTVGIIMFIIITMIMFLVVNKGTERVAEVSARFILDGIPGKQMSIDSDLNSGAIDLKTAQKRRNNLERESDFYKSMDGASKFIKGDAIAGLIITFVNIVGGLIMGMTRHGLTIGESVTKYTILSIGDGLVNQLPSLLIASAAAFMVTRGSGENGMGKDIMLQFFKYKEPFKIISVIFAILAGLSIINVLPDIPWVVCLVISLITFAVTKIDMTAFISSGEEMNDSDLVEVEENTEDVVENVLFVDKIVMFVGMNLVNSIVQSTNGGKGQLSTELKYRIEVLRDKIKRKYGVSIPNIRIKDDDYIPSNSCVVRIVNVPSVSIDIKPNCVFATFFNENTVVDFGEEVEFKELGLKGYWVPSDSQFEVESMGALTYSIYDLLIFYLENAVENNLDKLISREEIKQYKSEIESYNAAIIEEINHKQIENYVIQKVIQNLLVEKIPIKNLEYILECIADSYSDGNRPPSVDAITQLIRKNISNTITEDKLIDGVLNVVVLGDEATQSLISKFRGEFNEELELKCNNIYINIASVHNRLTKLGQKFVFLCDKSIRTDVFRIMSDFNIKIDIISYEELPKLAVIETIETL